jgi:hypothetical protein
VSRTLLTLFQWVTLTDVVQLDEGLDACMMVHPGQYQAGFGGIKPSLSKTGIKVAYTGKASHAAAAPCEWSFRWLEMRLLTSTIGDGINALDAAVLAYNNVSVLRQQIKPYERQVSSHPSPFLLSCSSSQNTWHLHRSRDVAEQQVLRLHPGAELTRPSYSC